ncbi:uncharacterized protein ACIB01_014674 [Guaruba guarouba]
MLQPVFHRQLPVTSETHSTDLRPRTLHLSCAPSDPSWNPKPFALLPALVSGSLLHGPHLGATVQPHRNTSLVLLAAQPSPCRSQEAKTCIHRVLKPLPPRKVLKRSKQRILRLHAPACQSWWVLLDTEPPAPSQLRWGRAWGPFTPQLCPGSERGPGCPEPCPTAVLLY